MKVQVNWLKKYLEIDAPVDELGHLLTMAGLEIENHERPDDEKGDVLEMECWILNTLVRLCFSWNFNRQILC